MVSFNTYLRRLLVFVLRRHVDVEQMGRSLLAEYGERVAKLLLKPWPVEVKFKEVEDTVDIAVTVGDTVLLNRLYFNLHPDDKGAIVHEIVHAVQRAPKYEGEFVWMIEGVADFIRHKTTGLVLEPGDPRQGYRKAARFFAWLYRDYPTVYRRIVGNVNDGMLPADLDVLVKVYREEMR